MSGAAAAPIVATFADGALLLDTRSGALVSLNVMAARIWSERLAGAEPGQIALRLARSFDLAEERARVDVDQTLRLPVPATAPAADAAPAPDLHYVVEADGYVVFRRGTPALAISADGSALRLMVALPEPERLSFLRAVSPKLLSLIGIDVLHASVVLAPGGRAIVIAGPSGAGKTTTARAFAGAGLTLACEDKLLLRIASNGAPAACIEGERRLEAWLDGLSSRLAGTAAGPWRQITDLVQVFTGAEAPLDRILLIDRARRGSEPRMRKLGETESAGAIFQNSFFGDARAVGWRRCLDTAGQLARTVPTFEAAMPSGVDRLAPAVSVYTETMRS